MDIVEYMEVFCLGTPRQSLIKVWIAERLNLPGRQEK